MDEKTGLDPEGIKLRAAEVRMGDRVHHPTVSPKEISKLAICISQKLFCSEALVLLCRALLWVLIA